MNLKEKQTQRNNQRSFCGQIPQPGVHEIRSEKQDPFITPLEKMTLALVSPGDKNERLEATQSGSGFLWFPKEYG